MVTRGDAYMDQRASLMYRAINFLVGSMKHKKKQMRLIVFKTTVSFSPHIQTMLYESCLCWIWPERNVLSALVLVHSCANCCAFVPEEFQVYLFICNFAHVHLLWLAVWLSSLASWAPVPNFLCSPLTVVSVFRPVLRFKFAIRRGVESAT